jgi:hypothetical protein
MTDTSIKYRYFVTDLVSNQVIAEIPFNGVSYERALKTAGSFSGSIPLLEETQHLDLYNSTMPGKTGLYVVRNGECVWGGIIWSRSYDIVGKTISVSASEFQSYLYHRKIWKTWIRKFDGVNVKADADNTDQLIVELPDESSDGVSIDEGAAVELLFLDEKGYPYTGHYRVNKTYRNSSFITVDKDALEYMSGSDPETPIVAQSKKNSVTSRTVSSGSKNVTINTASPHGLAVGDTVWIDKLESKVAKVYKSTTHSTNSASCQSGNEFVSGKVSGKSVSGNSYKFTGEFGVTVTQSDYDDDLKKPVAGNTITLNGFSGSYGTNYFNGDKKVSSVKKWSKTFPAKNIGGGETIPARAVKYVTIYFKDTGITIAKSTYDNNGFPINTSTVTVGTIEKKYVTSVLDDTQGYSPTAGNVNSQNISVAEVPSRTSFTVQSDTSSSVSSTVAGAQVAGATVTWDGTYQANLYLNTDTYDHVRQLLRNVFNDFVGLRYTNPFLGNLSKMKIRTANYNSISDEATISTGLYTSAHSKAIEVDPSDGRLIARIGLDVPYTQFILESESEDYADIGEQINISGNDSAINGDYAIKSITAEKDQFTYDLPDTEQDVETYAISAATASSGNVTYMIFNHSVQPGQLVTVANVNSTGSFSNLNVVNGLVVARTSNTVTVSLNRDGATYATSQGKLYFSTRTRLKELISPDATQVLFGAHNMTAGMNITIVGLRNQNYDGTWVITSTPSPVTFTYEPKFETLNVASTSITKKAVNNTWQIKLTLSDTPDTVAYTYRPGTTKLLVDKSGYGSEPSDISEGPKTLVRHDVVDGVHSFIYEKSTSSTQRVDVPVSYQERLVGDAVTINQAVYTASTKFAKSKPVKTGNGTATFTTLTSHGLVPGDYVWIQNIGMPFTELIGVDSPYTRVLIKVLNVTGSTTFTTDNQALTGVAYGHQPKAGEINATINTGGAGYLNKYDISPDRVTKTNVTVKIDDLPAVNSTLFNSANVTLRAFNAKNRMCYLVIDSDPGVVVGQLVEIQDVDDYNRVIFDGTYSVREVSKVSGGFRISYKSSNTTQKRDYGSWNESVVKGKKVKTIKASEPHTGGKVIIHSYVYSGSYGSFVNNSDIGIGFSTEEYSGNYHRIEDFRGHELTSVGEALSKYSDKYISKPGSTKTIRNLHGFEYRIDCSFDYETSSFKRTFVFIPIYYPGEPVHGEASPVSRFGADKVVFEYPGNIDSVSMDESAENAATRFWMVGSDGGTGTENAAKTFVGVVAKPLIDSGWPLLEATESNDQLDFLEDITDYANRYLNELRPPMGEFSVSVNGSLDPVVNTYKPGDWCSIIVNDPFVQERLSSDLEPRDTVIVRKILSYSVSVPDGNAFPESVSITMIPEWDVDKRGE